jgi:uncharacterized membrane protein
LASGALLWEAYATAWTASILRALATIPLLLFLQGFLVLRALMPRRQVDFEFVVLSIGMSITSTMLLGLLLHAFHAMNHYGWAIGSGAVCIGAASWSRFSGGGKSRASVLPTAMPGVRGAAIVCLGIVGALFAGAIVVARYGALNHRQFAYTDLWILPSDGQSMERVTVGIRNKEQRPSNYALELLANGKVLVRWPRFSLADNEERIEQVPIPMILDINQPVEARLYETGDPERLYRRAWLSNTARESRQCVC